MPKTTYRQLRIGLQLSLQNTPPTQAYPGVSALTLYPRNTTPARLGQTASHFPGIGVLSAQ
jgi:hypothetical protein